MWRVGGCHGGGIALLPPGKTPGKTPRPERAPICTMHQKEHKHTSLGQGGLQNPQRAELAPVRPARVQQRICPRVAVGTGLTRAPFGQHTMRRFPWLKGPAPFPKMPRCSCFSSGWQKTAGQDQICPFQADRKNAKKDPTEKSKVFQKSLGFALLQSQNHFICSWGLC